MNYTTDETNYQVLKMCVPNTWSLSDRDWNAKKSDDYMQRCLTDDSNLILVIAAHSYDFSGTDIDLAELLKTDSEDFFIYLLFGSFTVGTLCLAVVFLWTEAAFIKPIYEVLSLIQGVGKAEEGEKEDDDGTTDMKESIL